MKKFALHKTVMLVAALAIGSAGIAGDALARGGGGGGGGGGFGGGGGGGHGGGFGGGGLGGGGFGGHAGGFGGGHFAGGGYGGNMGHFGGPRFAGGYAGSHVNNYGHNDFHNRHVRVVSPFLFDDYGYDYGYYGYDNDCWTSQRVRTRTGWRYRSVWACY